MTTITEDQALKRWDMIPDNLREALCSEANADFIWKTCAAENIPEDKIYDAERISGYVLLGFLHPEDVSEEMSGAMGIDSRTTKNVQDALNARIFSPLRSDLDKIYSPLSKSEAAAGKNPMPISVIGSSSAVFRPADASAVSSAPKPIASSISTSVLTPQPPRPLTHAPTPAPAKPLSTSDVGWSKNNTSNPVVKLDASLVPPAAPGASQAKAAPAPIKSVSTQQSGPAHSGIGEFERMNILKKAPPTPGTAPSAPVPMAPKAPVAPTVPVAPMTPAAPAPAPTVTAPSAPAEPAPFMLHKDTTVDAAQKNASFTLEKSDTGSQMNMSSPKIPPLPRAAVLELGDKATNVPKVPAGVSGVTHYTDFKPPLSSVPTANSGPRNVTQIVPPAPQAPVPPKPPMPPTPPAPSAGASGPTSSPKPPQTSGDAPKEKVIIKNFP